MGRKNSRHYEPRFELSPETKRGIIIVLMFAVAGVGILSLLGLAGRAGVLVTTFLAILFGWGRFIFPLILILVGYFLINSERYEITPLNWVGLFLFELSFHGLLHLFIPLDKAFEAIGSQSGGGYVGLFLSYPLNKVAGFWATLIILIAIFIISFLITFNTSLNRLAFGAGPFSWFFSKIGGSISSLKLRRMEKEYNGDSNGETEDEEGEGEEAEGEEGGEGDPGEDSGEEEEEKGEPEQKKIPFTRTKVKISLPFDLLDNKIYKPTSGNIRNNQIIIQKTLENFGIDVEMDEVSVGPTVTQYTLKPSEGVKLSQITTLHNDLALALAAHPIRIEAPIPGKALVGIEVPNQSVATVTLREVLDSDEFRHRHSNLGMALGKDVAGQPWLADLGRMPHLLIAGATGSGKTVCINSIIVSLLYQNNPDDLRFLMIDPKRVELPVYNGIPYLVTPVITDVKRTINALKWAIREMDRRFELLNKFGKRDIGSFNQGVTDRLPYIIIVVDELADLMATAMSEIEGAIVRLAQMARAVGIHLIVATQRPSVEVITGLIKANITSRIAFSVASMVDSRTILDNSGAEKLLGRGDMLLVTAELSKPKRLQGTYVSDSEIKRVVEFLKKQAKPDYVAGVTEKPTVASSSSYNGGGYDGEEEDELMGEAKEVILQAGKASASLLQRRLKVGYARAARLLDILEEQGFIGPADGARPREVLSNEIAEEDYEGEEVEEGEDGETEETNKMEE